MSSDTVERLARGGKIGAKWFVLLGRSLLKRLLKQRLRAPVVTFFEVNTKQHQCRYITQRSVVDRGAYIFQFGGGRLKLVRGRECTGTLNPAHDRIDGRILTRASRLPCRKNGRD